MERKRLACGRDENSGDMISVIDFSYNSIWRYNSMQLLKTFSQKLTLKQAGCILYSLLLTVITFHALLFSGFTNMTGSMLQSLTRVRIAMNYAVYLLGAGAVAVELAQNWRRALLPAVLLALRWRVPVTWQSMMLLDTVMLAALSDLGSEKSNGGVWLALHVGYALMLCILLQCGWVQDIQTSAQKAVLGFQNGHSFGMGHPNSIGIMFMSTWMLLWGMFVPKRWWVTLAFFWAGGVLVLAATLCRTIAVLMLAFPLVYFVLNAVGRSRHPNILLCTAVMPFLMLVVSVMMGMSADNLRQYFGDGAFWIRFKEIDILRADGLTLFGRMPSRFAYFDNLYFWLLMYCGLIPTAGALLLCAGMLIRLVRRRRADLLAFAIVFLLYGLMENAAAYTVYFFVPVIAFASDHPITAGNNTGACS